MAAGLLFGIGLLPGFPFAGLHPALAAVMAGLGLCMQRKADEAEAAAAQAEADAEREAQEPEDSLAERCGSTICGWSSARPGAPDQPPRGRSARQDQEPAAIFARDYGFVLPAVRIKDEASLPPTAMPSWCRASRRPAARCGRVR